MSEHLSFQQKSIAQQGYKNLNKSQLKQLEWGLRFTPLVCSIMALIGIIYLQASILFVVAALGFIAFFFPDKHPMDLIYNHLVRHIFKAVKLPPNPLQRRLACFSAGIMNLTAAVLLLYGMNTAAIVIIAALLILQAIVISTHFCTLSWIYEGVMKAMGKWDKPIDIEQAKTLIKNGATIIDVRSVNEFAAGHLSNAINIPLETMDKNLEQIPKGDKVLYCASGARSQLALKLLTKHNIEQCYDLGSMNNGKKII